MFKKALLILIAVILFCGIGHAQDPKEILSVSLENNTNALKTSYIPITTIYPNDVDMLLGYEVLPFGTGHSELTVALFDSISTDLIEQYAPVGIELIGELEAADNSSAYKWFFTPRTITRGVAVRQGAYSIVNIYFTRG